MNVAIELNNVIRDINKQIIKYYKKDINRNFDENSVDLKQNDIISKLEFKTKKDRYNFLYIDYPYEIFGCANMMHRNLSNSIHEWDNKLNDLYDNQYHLSYFSLLEDELTIQSTCFFLSKIGSRVRKILFPKDGIEIWDDNDVVITTNCRVAKNKPSGKILILIKTSDNLECIKYADYVYDNLLDLINDKDLFKNIKHNNSKNNNLLKKLKSWILNKSI